MALDTVADVLVEARVLLQDTTAPYRYSDAELISALNIGVLEARRIRPDLFLGTSFTLPSFSTGGDAFAVEPMYRPTFVYYVVGRAQLRDAEPSPDERASALMNKFLAQLLSAQA